MVTRQNKKNDVQTTHTTKTPLWLGVLLVVISCGSLSLVFTSFPGTAVAGIGSPSPISSSSLTQPYSLKTPQNLTTSTSIASVAQPSKAPSEHSTGSIPSPAPLSLVALLLLVLASIIRRHQNQT